MKALLSDTSSQFGRITLVEKNKTISDDHEFAETFVIF